MANDDGIMLSQELCEVLDVFVIPYIFFMEHASYPPIACCEANNNTLERMPMSTIWQFGCLVYKTLLIVGKVYFMTGNDSPDISINIYLN